MSNSQNYLKEIVKNLSKVKLTVKDIAKILGPQIKKDGKEITVAINNPLFESATIHEFDKRIYIDFKTKSKNLKLKDITDSPRSWSYSEIMDNLDESEAVCGFSFGKLHISFIATIDGFKITKNSLVNKVEILIERL